MFLFLTNDARKIYPKWSWCSSSSSEMFMWGATPPQDHRYLPNSTHRPKAEPNDSKVKTEGGITVSHMLRDSKVAWLDAPPSWRLPVPWGLPFSEMSEVPLKSSSREVTKSGKEGQLQERGNKYRTIREQRKDPPWCSSNRSKTMPWDSANLLPVSCAYSAAFTPSPEYWRLRWTK